LKKTKGVTSKVIIGQLVKKYRLSKQLSQQQLADLLVTDRQYVWKLENGRINVTLEYLDKIILKLKCTHNDFFKSE
jgi:transcriptional regulator with XRE-family HTH domain